MSEEAGVSKSAIPNVRFGNQSIKQRCIWTARRTCPYPLWLRSTGAAVHFEHVGNLLCVQINKVGDKPDETLADFSYRLHDEISATKREEVAVDLRLNRGGHGSLIVPLVRSLIESKSTRAQSLSPTAASRSVFRSTTGRTGTRSTSGTPQFRKSPRR